MRALCAAYLPLYMLFLLVFLPPAQAQDSAYYPIGQIAKIEGDVFSQKGDNRKKVKTDDPVYLDTTIETGPNSLALILFIDDTQITLAENTELLIDEYVFDPYDSEENEADFEIMTGSFYWLGGMLSKRERPKVKVTTSVGSIGIRGTEFWGGNIEGGYGVFVNHGLVAFEGAWGSVDISADSGVFVTSPKDHKPNKEFWNGLRLAKAVKTVTFSNTDGLDQRLETLRRENIRKRHDYRGQMFPYKANPLQPGYLPEEDEFFTDEFIEMRDNR